MDYARAIRIARATRGISQRELAERAGVDPSYVSLVEAGARVPRMDRMEKLATALGVPLYLMMLLGSQRDDLRGASEAEATELGRRLLDALLLSDHGGEQRGAK